MLLALLIQTDFEALKAQFKAEQAEAYAKRYATIDKIGALKSDAAARFLLEALPGKTDVAVKGAIVRAGADTQTDLAFKALMEFAENENTDSVVKSNAVQAIGRFKNDRAPAFLIEKTREPTYRYRSSAMVGLQQFELDKKVKFNLVFFDNRIEPWKGKLQDASGGNVKAAVARIKALEPRGGTNIYDTLETAMQDPDVDTIFLLSDGSPGQGKYINTEDILREIKKLNRTRKIVIHTIALGRSPFMERPAKENGGRYVEK